MSAFPKFATTDSLPVPARPSHRDSIGQDGTRPLPLAVPICVLRVATKACRVRLWDRSSVDDGAVGARRRRRTAGHLPTLTSRGSGTPSARSGCFAPLSIADFGSALSPDARPSISIFPVDLSLLDPSQTGPATGVWQFPAMHGSIPPGMTR